MDVSSRHAGSERPTWMQKRPVPGSSSARSSMIVNQDKVSQLPRSSNTRSGWGNVSGDNEPSYRMHHVVEDPCSSAPVPPRASHVLNKEQLFVPDRRSWMGTYSEPNSLASPVSRQDGTTSKSIRRLRSSISSRPVSRSEGAETEQCLHTARVRRACSSGHRGAKCVSDLEALQQESLAEDTAMLQQLASVKEQAAARQAVSSSKTSMPVIRKPAEDPPSLRAWRRNRQMEAACPGAGLEEQRRQVSRLKQNLNELVHEVRQLQDLMEDDAMEFAENVQTIQRELQASRERRSIQGTPATSAGPSMSNSAFSSVAPSEPSTPRSERPSLSAGQIRNAMLRAAVESQRTSPSTSHVTGPSSAILSMTPLPVSLINNLGRRSIAGTAHVESCFHHCRLAALALIASKVVEFVTGVSALIFASVCSTTAYALHTRSGHRIWPHVEISVGQCCVDDVVMALRKSISWSSIRSFSIFGSTDATFLDLLEIVAPKMHGRAMISQRPHVDVQSSPIGINTLRFCCSGKGSKGAMQTRQRHGDHMGIGNQSFHELVLRVSEDPLRNQIRELDVGWNHLDDGAMESLLAFWPVNLSTLCLQWNHIGTAGALSLASGLVSSAAAVLKSINMRSNPLGDEGVVALCRAVAERIGLTFLGIGETMLTDEGAKAAMPLLRGHSTLEVLDIGENVLTAASCEAIGGMISSTPMLHTLILRGFLFEPTRISDAGGVILARAVVMREAITLTRQFSLDLDYQQVACGTAAEIARRCSAWSRVSLFNTDVSTMGAMSLANALRQQDVPAAMLKLNIAQCRVGEGAVKLLRNVKLARLDCHGQRGPIRV